MLQHIAAPFLRFSTLLAIIVLLGWSAIAQSHAQDAAAKQFLQGIYKQYLGKNASGPDYSSPDKASRYFDEPLTQLIVRDQKESEGEVGRIGFDPFTYAQDFQIKSVDVSISPVDADHARGIVTFLNLGHRQKVTYDLVKTAKGWRISDISWSGTKDTFRALLSQPL